MDPHNELVCEISIARRIHMIAQRGNVSRFGRATVLATVAAVTLTAVQPTLAFAGSAPGEKGVVAKTASDGGLTDISVILRAGSGRSWEQHPPVRRSTKAAFRPLSTSFAR